MKHYLSIVVAVLFISSQSIAAPMVGTPATLAAWHADYDAACREYARRSVSVQDVWAGWMRTVGGIPEIHLATGRVLNTGNEPVVVADVRIALLDQEGKVLVERAILAYPEGTAWQPRIEPGQAAAFYELLPPTEGVPPVEWTGEVRITVTRIELPESVR